MTRSKNRRARALLTLTGTALGLALAPGCAQTEEPARPTQDIPRAFLEPPSWDSGTRPVTEFVGGDRSADRRPPEVVSRVTLRAPAAAEPATPALYESDPGALRRVKIATNGARPQEILRYLVGEQLGRSFVLDPQVEKANQLISLDVDEEMTPADVRHLLEGVAVLYGWSVTDRDGTLYVRPASSMPADPATPIIRARAAFESTAPAVRVRRLRHIGADAASTAIKPMLSEGASAVAVGSSLVMLDTTAQLNRLSRLISVLDVPSFDGVRLWTYRLGSRSPEQVRDLLDDLAGPTRLGGGATGEPLVAFVPLPGTDRLMVISRDETVQPLVGELIAQVDRPANAAERFRYLYRIQHYDPQALVNLVREFLSDIVETTASGVTASRAAGGAAALGRGAAPGQGIRLVLDPAENILLIEATPEHYAELLDVLKMVDRPRQQVALNSIIAEVALRDRLEFGVEYFLRAFDIDGLGILELAGGAADLTLPPTGSAFFAAGDGFAIVTALDNESDVNILSQPRVTVRDGELARILVGGRTPVTEGDIDTTTGGLRRDIRYEEIGVELTIQAAQINESGEVTLTISQRINAINDAGSSDLGPEFTTREVETVVTVPHGRTLLLGGIIETVTRDNRRKIPILADIPGLGVAFQSVEQTTERNELFLAITPTIVNTPAEAELTVSDFLNSAEAVRSALFEMEGDFQQGTLRAVLSPDVPEPTPVLIPGPEPRAQPEPAPTGAAPIGAVWAPAWLSPAPGALDVPRVDFSSGWLPPADPPVITGPTLAG